MTARARAAVVGCGVISKEHFHVLGDHPRIELVGVCDRSPAAARWTAERYRTHAFTDHAVMLAETRPDVVHVLTPPSSHRSITEATLRAGAHVIVEKPIAPSRSELDEMFAVADQCERHLVENHNNLFNDQILAIDDLVARGALGEIVGVDVLLALDIHASKFAAADGNPTSHLAGGAVRDFLTHLTYLGLHYFPGADLGAVDARWANRSRNPYIGADDFDARIELGDGVVHLRFDARIAPDCFRVWVRGTAGSVETDFYHPFLRTEVRRGPKLLSPILNHAVNGVGLASSGARNLRDKVLQKSPYHGLWRFLEVFYWSVLDGTPPPVSRADVLRTNDLVDRMVEIAAAAMKLFITGGSGFIGTAVVTAAVFRGHEVTSLVRRAEAPSRHGVTIVVGDVRHPAAWIDALQGVDVVVHLAAATGGDFHTQFATTVVGTEALLGAIRERGISRLVHISTFSVYDYRTLTVGSLLDEHAPIEARPLDRDEYTQTKLEQERLVREFAADGGAVTIVRPGSVYGPGHLWNAGLAMPLPGGWGIAYSPLGRQKLTYVENCAEAVVLAAERPGAIDATLNIVDDDLPTQRAYARALRRAGFEVRRAIPVPYRVAVAMAALLAFANDRLVGGRAKFPAVVVPAKLDAQYRPLRYGNDEAKQVLGWRPRYSLAEALKRSRLAELDT